MPKSGGTFSGSVTFEKSLMCANICSTDESYSMSVYTFHPGDDFSITNGDCTISFTSAGIQINARFADIMLSAPNGHIYANGIQLDLH